MPFNIASLPCTPGEKERRAEQRLAEREGGIQEIEPVHHGHIDVPPLGLGHQSGLFDTPIEIMPHPAISRHTMTTAT